MDKFFVPVHDDDSMERPGMLRVDHVVRFFRPVDTVDTWSVESRFYETGAVRLGLVWLSDDTDEPVTVRLSPDMARYLAQCLFHAADQLDEEREGSEPSGSSHDVDF